MKITHLFAALAIVAATGLTAAPALAQSDDECIDPGTGEKVTCYGEKAWSDHLVDGDLVRPDGDLVGARPRFQPDTLITVRKGWVVEMLKSVEGL